MSIVSGPVETYRGTSEGFLGSEGKSGSGGGGGGVTGAFGDAINFVALTVNNGSVTAATTFPRAVGSTGVVGDANNYPVLTLTNGEVTVASTQPRSVGVSGTFGDATHYPVVTVANGELTSVSVQARSAGVTGSYGDASNFPVVTVVDGEVTAVSTQPRAVGITGSYGDASNFPVVTLVNGEVTAVSTQPRAVGTTGTYGDANNYPVLTLTNGEVTASSTAPRQVATGVVAASYGSAFATPSFAVDAFGALTSASSLATRFPAVLWSAVDSTAFGAGANLTYSAVVFNSSNCISEVVAGTSMTVSATGLYLAFAYNIITVATMSALRFQVNGVTTVAGCTSANVTQNAVGLLALTAGNVVTTSFSLAVTTSASTRYFGLVKVS